MLEKLMTELAYMSHGIQILALIGSAFVLTSFVCKGERNIRFINMIGSAFSLIYSLFTKQWSNLSVNIMILITNAYNLFFRKKT